MKEDILPSLPEAGTEEDPADVSPIADDPEYDENFSIMRAMESGQLFYSEVDPVDIDPDDLAIIEGRKIS